MKIAYNKITLIIMCFILSFLYAIIALVVSFIEKTIFLGSIGLIPLILCVIVFKDVLYQCFFIKFRKLNFVCKKLNEDEIEIVEDAKKLIKSVDYNIVITDFNIYKVDFSKKGWFYYDNDTRELCIFIPFKRFLRISKDLCFLAVVHEILHSQNLKNNLNVFDVHFLEGLNQILTNWLIENYSLKYEIPKKNYIDLNLIKNVYLEIEVGVSVYTKEVAMVQGILQKSGVELREVFLNYINFNPKFFENFVPYEQFKDR